MNNKELLKRFVELAPKEWNAWMATDGTCCLFEPPGYGMASPFIHLGNDPRSSLAIIFLWNYLEKEGCWLSIGGTRHHGDSPVCDAPYGVFEPGSPPRGKGLTRIEALVRACVAYWESTGNQEGE